jgi:aldehyde oxidoreductase
VFAAAADPGEGNDAMLTQITAHRMNLPLARVRLVTRDTDRTAASGPAAGSRITFMVGGALVDALDQLKGAMDETKARTGLEMKNLGRPVRFIGRKKSLEAGPLDPATGQGPSFDSQVHALQMAEVEVDTRTGEVRVIRMTTAVDAGPLIHPQNVEGQLEGGMDMGVGFALREKYIAGQTRDWLTFPFPRIKDSFDMDVIVRETPRKRGTLGVVGVGEMTMVPTAPAVMNAIYDACGVRIFDLPATPDKIRAALGLGA